MMEVERQAVVSPASRAFWEGTGSEVGDDHSQRLGITLSWETEICKLLRQRRPTIKLLENESGFTMIELVVVIVILGILAAFAVPRYIAIQTQARVSAVNGLAGGLRGAAASVKAQYIVTGAAASPITLPDGVTVAVGTAGAATGIPTGAAGGIDNAMQDYSGFTFTAGTPTTFTLNGAPTPANCVAFYDPGTGIVTVTIFGC
jgi:MSHA pilin protein MshA